MSDAQYSVYRRARRGVLAAALAALVAGTSMLNVLAADGTFSGGGKVAGGGSYGDTQFTYSTYTINVGNQLYQYATGKDGNAYYDVYDGNAWSGWQATDGQPAKVTYDPAPVEYQDNNYAFYTGEDGQIYHLAWAADGSYAWDDVAAGNSFKCAPYANVNGDWLYLYGTGEDGLVYHRPYSTDTGWGDWAVISDDYTSAYEPYALAWSNHENAFWTGADGIVYWNRYDGTAWEGAKGIPSSTHQFQYAPYAVAYKPEKALYAYAAGKDGKAYYNVFTEADGWTGWKRIPGLKGKIEYQPNAYVYDGVQNVVYTGANGHAYYTSYDGTAWADWQDLGANYDFDPYQYEYGDGYYLTYTGQDSAIYVKPYAAGGEETDDSGY